MKKMSKLLSVFAMIAMFIGILPLAALAATPSYPVYDGWLLPTSVTITTEDDVAVLTVRGVKYELKETSNLYTNLPALYLDLNNTEPVTINSIYATRATLLFSGNGVLNVNSDKDYGINVGGIEFTKGHNPTVNTYGTDSGVYTTQDQGIKQYAGTLNATGGKRGIFAFRGNIYVRNDSVMNAGLAANSCPLKPATVTESGIELYLGEFEASDNAVITSIGEKNGIYAERGSVSAHGSNSLVIASGNVNGIHTATKSVVASSGGNIVANGGEIGILTKGVVYARWAAITADGGKYGIYANETIISEGPTAVLTGFGGENGVNATGNGYVSVTARDGAQLIGIASNQDGVGVISSVNGPILAEIGGVIEGYGYIGVQARGNIIAKNKSHIYGYANDLNNDVPAVDTAFNISANTNSSINEIYENSGILLGSDPLVLTDEYPAIRDHVASMENYIWSNPSNTIAMQDGGLIATGIILDETVTGTRTAKVTNEPIALDDSSTHNIMLGGFNDTLKREVTIEYYQLGNSTPIDIRYIEESVGAIVDLSAGQYESYKELPGYTLLMGAPMTLTVSVNNADNVIRLYFEFGIFSFAGDTTSESILEDVAPAEEELSESVEIFEPIAEDVIDIPVVDVPVQDESIELEEVVVELEIE